MTMTLGDLTVIPRSAWAARPPTKTVYQVEPTTRDEHWTHWNGGPLSITEHADCLPAVARMQEYHQAGRGWSDIGYNLLICPHAAIIEGRGVDAVGAHCVDHNRRGYGIQMMIGEGQHPAPAQLTAARRLWEALNVRSGHTLTRYGHRDGMQTTCPGDELHTWVHAGMPVATIPPATTHQEDPMTLTRPVVIIDAETTAEHLVTTLEEALERISRSLAWLRDRHVPVLVDDPILGRGSSYAQETVPIALAHLALAQQIKATADRLAPPVES